MKKIFYLLFLFSFLSYSQQASKVNNAQNVWTSVANPTVLIGCNPSPDGLFKIYLKDDIRWETYNINGLNTQIQSVTGLLYEPLFSKNTAFNKNFGNVSGTVAEGNDSRILNGQSAYTDLPNYLLSAIASTTYQPIGSYLTAESDPTVPTYSKTLSAFSVIKASTDPLYKSITYTPTNLEITTALGFIPYNSTNPSGYISSVPAQSFNSLTGKPTTLLGYGIIDAYPLAGNPSNFLTSVTSGQVTGALGFIPLSVEVDGSTTNEIQALSILGSTVSLSNGGGSIVIPGTVYTAGTGISIGSNIITNSAPDQTIALTGAGGLVVSGSYPNFTLTQYTPTINSNVARSLNTNFTISSSTAKVSYTVRIAYSVTVLLGSTGTIDLQYSTNAGSSWVTVSTVSNNLNLGLALTGYNDFVLSGDIPANALVRLNSTTTNAINTYRTGQETF